MKECSVCNEIKDLSNFDKKKSGSVSGYCKECRKAKMRQHYEDNKQYYVDKAARSNQKMRQFVRDAKSVPCKDCGIQYPYYVMDFDHLGDKEFTISSFTAQVGLAKMKAEIAKCDVVCSNCHRTRTHERNILP